MSSRAGESPASIGQTDACGYHSWQMTAFLVEQRELIVSSLPWSAEAFGRGWQEMAEISLDGIEACWLDDTWVEGRSGLRPGHSREMRSMSSLNSETMVSVRVPRVSWIAAT